QRTQNLVFRYAFPFRSTRNLAMSTVIAVMLSLLPAFMLADQHAEFTQRLLGSCFAPPALQFEVSPGNGHAAQGRPLTWSVKLARRDARVVWPQHVNLILTDQAGRKKQILMQAQKETVPDDKQVFTCAVDQVSDSFSYYIEAGGHRSSVFKIQTVEPVTL